MSEERVWHVTYSFDGQRHHAHEVGCVCTDREANKIYGLPPEHWDHHYHVGGVVHRKPDRIVRKPCDPLYRS